jgi:hypothetical protein
MTAANSLFVINPYRERGTWVFDDPAAGLVKEPFVSGIPAIIEKATEHIPMAANGFRAVFSLHPFPGYNVHLTLLRQEYAGGWYRWEKENLEGWLCPALYKYFDVAPKDLYIQVSSLGA